MKRGYIKDSYKNKLSYFSWNKTDRPMGIILILIGLNEHSLRYDAFAQYCNEQGFIVFSVDYVSQGMSRKENEEYVNFGKNGDLVLIEEVSIMKEKIRSIYPDLPINIVSHSMGTSIIRSYLTGNSNQFEKIVLLSTGYQSPFSTRFILFIGNILAWIKPNKPLKFFDSIFRKTQLRIKKKTTINHFIEWLTRDIKQNQKDKNDDYLFIRVTVQGFLAVFRLILKSNKNSDKMKNGNYLLLSGSHDPITNFGESTKKLHQLLSKNNKSQLKIYPKARHDLLHEINKKDVFNDIITYLKSN
ncbi:MAG: lysophospholipase [Candidatus Izimaplasma sp.]|nr:lysophospholipase [Candidatus Izimaplasma bacterium]